MCMCHTTRRWGRLIPDVPNTPGIHIADVNGTGRASRSKHSLGTINTRACDKQRRWLLPGAVGMGANEASAWHVVLRRAFEVRLRENSRATRTSGAGGGDLVTVRVGEGTKGGGADRSSGVEPHPWAGPRRARNVAVVSSHDAQPGRSNLGHTMSRPACYDRVGACYNAQIINLEGLDKRGCLDKCQVIRLSGHRARSVAG